MVAAHGGDLEAAAACGLRTAFVPRARDTREGDGGSTPTSAPRTSSAGGR